MKTAVKQLSSQINIIMARGKDSMQVIESCANQIGSLFVYPSRLGATEVNPLSRNVRQ